jgi:hypothetical protein
VKRKVTNTKKYRADKRVTAFLTPPLKKTVLKYAKIHDMTISRAVERILVTFFSGDGN